MSAALPACLQPRLGLQVFGSIPPGCMGFLIDDDHSEPVLRNGEIAVVDVTIREPAPGALFDEGTTGALPVLPPLGAVWTSPKRVEKLAARRS